MCFCVGGESVGRGLETIRFDLRDAARLLPTGGGGIISLGILRGKEPNDPVMTV